jgi:hypothetical protein
MTLENLLRIGQLREHPVESKEIRKLLEAAERNLKDSGFTEISPETRFDAAYKAIMQAALAALMANGYRPSTSKPGHQMTTLQTLTTTIGLSGERMNVLDVLRRKRNLADYTGADIDSSTAENCALEGQRLLTDVKAWLRANHQEFTDNG